MARREEQSRQLPPHRNGDRERDRRREERDHQRVPLDATIEPFAEGGTDAEAAQKRGEHEAEGVGGVADEQREQMRVHHLRREHEQTRREREDRQQAIAPTPTAVLDALVTDVLRLGRDQLPPGDDRDRADREVDQRRRPHRRVDAEPGEHDVGAEQRSQRASRGVDRVQARQPTLGRRAGGAALPRDGPREHGQGQPHGDRRHQHHQRRDQPPYRAHHHQRPGQRANRRQVSRGHPFEEPRRDRANRPHHDLRDAVGHQRLAKPCRVPAPEPRPERQAAHERREHRAHRVGGRPEDRRELLAEGDLVQKRRSPRQEKQRRDHAETPARLRRVGRQRRRGSRSARHDGRGLSSEPPISASAGPPTPATPVSECYVDAGDSSPDAVESTRRRAHLLPDPWRDLPDFDGDNPVLWPHRAAHDPNRRRV